MIYTSQTILSTNSEIFIPTTSTILSSGEEHFERNGITTTLPSIVYSFLPVRPDANSDGTFQDRIVSPQNWNANSRDLLAPEALTCIRVFLVPHSDSGSTFCTYGMPTSSAFTITQYNDVVFMNKSHYFFVETRRGSLQEEPSLPAQNQTGIARSPNSQLLGPAIRINEQHRVIN